MNKNTFNCVALLAITAAVLLSFFACSNQLPQKETAAKKHAAPASDAPSTPKARKALFINSYHEGYAWSDELGRGMKETFAPENVEFEIFYMDTKRKTDEAWMIQAGELAKQKIDQFKPGVIITGDDNAQKYLGMKYVGTSMPIVFTGVNEDPSKYGYPSTNATGVIERPNTKAGLELLNLLKPVKKIAMLSCNDVTSRATFTFMKDDIKGLAEVVEWKLVDTFEEWQQAVQTFNKKADAIGIYMYHTLKKQGESVSMKPEEVMKWTAENATVPTLGFFAFSAPDGMLCALAESGHEHGQLAAQYALKIMNGTPVNQLPIIKASQGTAMINLKTAKKLKLNIPANLPQNVIVKEY